MTRTHWLAVASFAGLLVFALVGFAAVKKARADKSVGESAPLRVVDRVDLERYLGTWYSIASIPQVFDRNCASGTTATYSLRPDGDVEVYNACYRKDGSLDEARGRAWVVDKETNAKLKVSFLPRGLKLNRLAGDYWIIDLGENYEFAVVGHPRRTYGWILSRTPELSEETLAGIVQRMEAQGYDFKKFEMVKH